jgi:plasmid stability protein
MGIIEKIAVDSATLARLEEKAKAHGRSVAEEAAETLRQATDTPTRAEMLKRFDEIAAMTPKGVKQTDSTLLIREDRDSR